MQGLNEQLSALACEISAMMLDQLHLEVRSPEEDLLSSGQLDSLTLVQLLVGLEGQFGIKVPLDQLQIEDVRSVASLAHLVEQQRRDIQAQAAPGRRE